MWAGFAKAIVRLDLAEGPRTLRPKDSGDIGQFPYKQPVHIITAYNPAGLETNEAENEDRHRALAAALQHQTWVPSVGSAPDGSFAEPGCAVLDLGVDDALRLGREFGQRAIYQWTPNSLQIIGVDEPVTLSLGWALE